MHILFNFTRVRTALAIIFLCALFVSRVTGAESKNTLRSLAVISCGHKPNPALLKFMKKQNQRKKAIASALAFPVPFGFLGVHRIYLGTQPYVPLAYVGTLGGVGILPMIDFWTLISNKDISRFQHNPRIFMWVDNAKKK